MALITIASGTATGGSYPERIAIYIGVEMISQDVANNRGTYRIKTWLKNNTTWTPYNTWPGDNAYYLRIDGVTIKSGYQFVDFRSSSTHVIADETITRDHDANGNLSFLVETRQAIDAVSTFDYAWRNGTYNAPQIKRASKVTASNANIDAAIPITITPEQSGVLHDIAVKYGSTTIKTLTAQGTPTSITLTAGEWSTLYNLTKTVGSFNLDIVVTTKLSGSVIGTNSATSIITYPSAVIPTLGSVTVSDLNATVPAVVGAGNFVQLLSELRVIMNSVAGVKGSTISEYELIINGTNHGAISKNFTPATSGAYAVTARVKDSRGRWSAQKTLNFSVIAYEKPKITGYRVIRSNSAGTLDQLGTYSKHTGTLSVKSIVIGTEKNQLRYKIDKVVNGTATNILATVTHTSISKAISHVLGTYSIDTAHVFRVTAYDKFNQTSIADFTLPTSRVPFTLSKTGASIGGIFENSDPSVAQIYGDLNVKDSGVLRMNGIEVPRDKLITSGQDFNNFTETGNYYCPANATAATLLNRPSNYAFSLIVTKHAGVSQMVIPYDSTYHTVYHRNMYNGTWGTWRDIAGNGNAADEMRGGTATYSRTDNGYILFGPQNTTWAHIYTDRPNFYFNKDIYVNGTKLGGGSTGITGGDINTGWEDLPGNLRRCWKTYSTTVLGTTLTTTGPTGTYKSAWINPGNWPAAFTAAPRYVLYDVIATAGSWLWRGSIRDATATAPGDFFIYRFGSSDSVIKVIVEAVGPR